MYKKTLLLGFILTMFVTSFSGSATASSSDEEDMNGQIAKTLERDLESLQPKTIPAAEINDEDRQAEVQNPSIAQIFNSAQSEILPFSPVSLGMTKDTVIQVMGKKPFRTERLGGIYHYSFKNDQGARTIGVQINPASNKVTSIHAYEFLPPLSTITKEDMPSNPDFKRGFPMDDMISVDDPYSIDFGFSKYNNPFKVAREPELMVIRLNIMPDVLQSDC